jgi:hypothetical protein
MSLYAFMILVILKGLGSLYKADYDLLGRTLLFHITIASGAPACRQAGSNPGVTLRNIGIATSPPNIAAAPRDDNLMHDIPGTQH